MRMGFVLGRELGREKEINREEKKGKERKEESAMPIRASSHDA